MTTPSAPFNRWLRGIFIDGAATPPFQGGESLFHPHPFPILIHFPFSFSTLHSHSRSFSIPAHSLLPLLLYSRSIHFSPFPIPIILHLLQYSPFPIPPASQIKWKKSSLPHVSGLNFGVN